MDPLFFPANSGSYRSSAGLFCFKEKNNKYCTVFKLCSNSFGKEILTVSFQNSPKLCLYTTWIINSFGFTLNFGLDWARHFRIIVSEFCRMVKGGKRFIDICANWCRFSLSNIQISVLFGLFTSVMMSKAALTNSVNTNTPRQCSKSRQLTELTCTVAAVRSNYRLLLRKLRKSQRVEAEQPEDIRGGKKLKHFSP